MAKKEKIQVVQAEEISHDETAAINRIEQTLIKYNVTENALLQMEQEYLKLEIIGLDDKDGYTKVDDARKRCKKTRVLTDKLCEDGRAEAIKEQREWIATQKAITGRIKTVEDILAARQAVIDDEKDRINLEKEQANQLKLQTRSAELLTKYGMTLDPATSEYVLQDVRISVISVKTADEFTWTNILARIEPVWKAMEEQKAEARRLQEEAEAEARRRADEVRLKEEELAAKERALAEREQAAKEAEARAKAAEEAQIKAQKEAAEREVMEKAEAVKKELENRIKGRKSALFQLGFSQQYDKLVFNELSFSDQAISEYLDDQWNGVIETTAKQVGLIKERLESERLAREEKIRQEAAEKEKERQEKEQKAAKEKADAEAAEQARKEALKPDSEKLSAYMTAVLKNVPEFTSEPFKNFRQIIEIDLKECLTKIYSKLPK